MASKERVMTKENISVMHFAAHEMPTYDEVIDKKLNYVKFGKYNDWPQYLIKLFNNSAKHNAIVTGKVQYICGGGFESETPLPENITDCDTTDDLLFKVCTDLEVFSGIAIQVIPNKAKTGWAQLAHIDISKIRTSKDRSRIFWCDKWSEEKNEFFKPKDDDIKELPLFNPKTFSGVYLYTQYRVGMCTYPLPEYIGSVAYISIDVEISNFHNKNINTGFSAGTMISFNNGTPGPEEISNIEKKIKSKFTGTDKAGEIVLTFSDGKDSAPTIIPLMSNNFGDLWNTLNQTAQQEIFTGHKVVSPMLFGIKTEGQLGGSNELLTAWELFKNGYVANKQKILEDIFNYLFSLNKYPEVKIKAIEPIQFNLSENNLMQVYTKDELREKLGLPITDTGKSAAQATLDALNTLSPLVATKVLEAMTPDEIRSLAALGPSVQAPVQMKANISEDDLISEFAGCGVDSTKIKVLHSFDVCNKIESFSRETEIFKEAFEKKTVAGSPVKGIKILYSYALRNDAPSLIPGGSSRPFCKKMMALNRLYTRAEIDMISAKLGYDVFDRRGGFYHDPENDVTTNFCRHTWRQNVIQA